MLDNPLTMPKDSTTSDLEELERRNADAFGRRDFGAGMAFYAEDAVWDMSALGMGVFRGRRAIRRFFDEWVGAYEELEQQL